LDSDTIPDVKDNPLTIGHDVWIGQNVIIAPGCRQIGDGAMVASGAILTADVPPFAIVGGVPAKLIRWRFPEEVQNAWRQSQWWLKPVTELGPSINLFFERIELEDLRNFRLPLLKNPLISQEKGS
jgi:virginiamycin A acetyltransferase